MAKLEKAKIGDVPKIQQLVNSFADKGEMLARPLSEIYENLRDYFIIREDDKIIGCCVGKFWIFEIHPSYPKIFVL